MPEGAELSTESVNMRIVGNTAVFAVLIVVAMTAHAADPVIREYSVPDGSRPHDVAPAVDGGVWYTAQGPGALGYLDPTTGNTRHITLDRKSTRLNSSHIQKSRMPSSA